MDLQKIQAVVLNILAFVLLLITFQLPLDDGTFPLQQRLFPDFLLMDVTSHPWASKEVLWHSRTHSLDSD